VKPNQIGVTRNQSSISALAKTLFSLTHIRNSAGAAKMDNQDNIFPKSTKTPYVCLIITSLNNFCNALSISTNLYTLLFD
jgi:hypothetical protein